MIRITKVFNSFQTTRLRSFYILTSSTQFQIFKERSIYLGGRNFAVSAVPCKREMANSELSLKDLKEKYADKIIDGKAASQKLLGDLKQEIVELKEKEGVIPGLAVILVGSRPDSAAYVSMKKKTAHDLGLHSVDITLPETITQEELISHVDKLNADEKIHAILVQLPLPSGINESEVLNRINSDKDVDGFTNVNIAKLASNTNINSSRSGPQSSKDYFPVPCTPAGCMYLLQNLGYSLQGKSAVVLGRSKIVGLPMFHLLLGANCTVTVCHSRTPSDRLQKALSEADIVVAAIGRAEFVSGKWLKPGCTVIDVGINEVVLENSGQEKKKRKLVGDVNFREAIEVAGKITPVPGGVGPMTIATLMSNTVQLAKKANGL